MTVASSEDTEKKLRKIREELEREKEEARIAGEVRTLCHGTPSPSLPHTAPYPCPPPSRARGRVNGG
jgi:hypothetical protein